MTDQLREHIRSAIEWAEGHERHVVTELRPTLDEARLLLRLLSDQSALQASADLPQSIEGERVKRALYDLINPMSPDYADISPGYLAERAATLIRELTADDSARSLEGLEGLIQQWRERARRVRPLEDAPISAEKRARMTEYIWFTNRANELEAVLRQTAERN